MGRRVQCLPCDRSRSGIDIYSWESGAPISEKLKTNKTNKEKIITLFVRTDCHNFLTVLGWSWEVFTLEAGLGRCVRNASSLPFCVMTPVLNRQVAFFSSLLGLHAFKKKILNTN